MTTVWQARLGWSAVATSTALTSLWAFWGSIETFHENYMTENNARIPQVGDPMGPL